MEFSKMITITLYARQKKRHRCIEQTFGLYGRRRGWDDLREQHRNMLPCFKRHVVGEYQGANNAQGLEIMPPRVLLNELRR